nr:pro-sigmaK processing inhibitor BofA family protein [uncultured Sellimonas sp.]
MEGKGTEIIINFIIRAILGMTAIFFINELLSYNQIPISVGMNGLSFLTSGVLGLPGVAMLYGIICIKNL